jgi:hypothetical protein
VGLVFLELWFLLKVRDGETLLPWTREGQGTQGVRLDEVRAEGIQFDIIRRKSTSIQRSRKLRVLMRRRLQPDRRLGPARNPVNRRDEHPSARRHAPVILRASAVGCPHRRAQHKHLNPDQGPDDGEVRREAGRGMQE